ncbi:chaperone protein [Azorhizobium caulinodans ORS 571]|uniref:Chaperone protein HtpG n=1 Tax=Azorhizobium caulinodans (strain ATCC 43989 / DSM 5975 / JCM 20966 / LMG 6465 / NBRC 14845 / NCIMB 13405 / ORS 571) TaxID=438753 RepID=HTPG_AZOC5|nr:molecular chaperone HtpG [Azorhizobium caulinodans]A8HVS4.1 RecName: Full=Chaperone protein HtpG; AltName: Full=Heat shock protein HtpG; AltName: Full=High temperature protein G [Azorhizobium caulinodans ORS 571]BAF90350.1 chaperone protein [Azorhizobium caulinodans ORS 571]
MTTAEAAAPESRTFEADVAKLLHLMVHSVYSDKDVFLRELISNAADACEKLRYEAITTPALLGEDARPRITLAIDAEGGRLTVEDNGIGMSRDEMVEALGTIARSGTKAFMERIEAAAGGEKAELIGQFGVGFYSAFMVAEKVDVISRRAGADTANIWSSDGKGAYTVGEIDVAQAPARGTRVVLHLNEDGKAYADRFRIERIVKEQSGHVPVPIYIVEKLDAEPEEIADGVALWTKSKSDISAEDYADFYRSVAGQFDQPALTVHFRAEGRHEYTALVFVPSTKPFDLFEPERTGRVKLYVKRVFITDDAELLPRYLRFVRGVVDSADLPLNLSREMLQDSAILAAIRKGVTGRVLTELEKLAQSDAEAYAGIWSNFGAVLKEGLYEDYERRAQLLNLARFKTTTSGTAADTGWRTLKDYVADLKENQTAIYYITGDLARVEHAPQLEGFRARGVEVLLLPDQVDSFWVTAGVDYEGKPFKSVTQGAADLSLIPLPKSDEAETPEPEAKDTGDFIAFVKETLGDQVADVRASDRLTTSAVCLVAPESGIDRRLEKLLASAGRLGDAAKPVLEINPRHPLVAALAAHGASDSNFRADAAHLLLDQARVLDGDQPSDPQAFAERLMRVMQRGLPTA